VAGFYDRLQQSRDIATALALAKRAPLGEGNVPDWSSFQLFVN
jgi:hypothetical protein